MFADLTPPEQEFADSPAGQAHIAAAKRVHDMQERHKGLAALPWTDTLERQAIRRGTSDAARAAISAEVFAKSEAYRQGEIVALRALRNDALARQSRERSRRAR